MNTPAGRPARYRGHHRPTRTVGWYLMFAYFSVIGLAVWLVLLLAMPIHGACPRHIRLVFETARRHADQGGAA